MAGEFVSDVKEEEHADDLRNLIERLGGDAESAGPKTEDE